MPCYNMNNSSFQVLFVWKPFHLCHKSLTIEMNNGIQQIDRQVYMLIGKLA
jgi:hypothetical protein